MDEILKKLEEIGGQVSGMETRLDKIEAFSIKLGQKIVDVQNNITARPAVNEAPVKPYITPSVEEPVSESRMSAGHIGLSTGILAVADSFISVVHENFNYIISTIILGLFYFLSYQAYANFGLISAGASFLLMIVVILAGGIVSSRLESMSMASLFASAGFLLPYLFGLRAATDLGYFLYILALNAGILAAAYYKKWHPLTIVGFVGTAMVYTSWFCFFYSPEKLPLAIYSLTVFYMIYLATSLFNNFILDVKSDEDDLIMFTLNPIWFFVQLFFLLQAGANTILAVVALGMSIEYILLAFFFHWYRNDDKTFSVFLGMVSALFLTVGIALVFPVNGVTVAWAVEAVLISMLGALTANDGMKRAALIVFGLALVKFFALDNLNLLQDISTWMPFFNKAFFTYLILIFTSVIIAYLFGHIMGEEYRSDVRLINALWIIAALLILASFVGEVQRYLDHNSFIHNQSIIRTN